MKSNDPRQKRGNELLAQLLDGGLSEEERRELNVWLKSDPAARKRYREHASLHAQLHQAYAAGGIGAGTPPVRELERTAAPAPGRSPWAGGWCAWLREGSKWAALIAVGVGGALILPLGGVRAVATLVSNEDAAWESRLPTVPHSRLKPGLLHLKSGMATIRFDSGAQVTLEAPAKLELIDAKRGRMSLGAATVEVPQRAIGFVMEAPHGFAVDHGTKFAMAVDASGRESTFEVLSGEISVHHPVGRAERLVQNQATKVTEGGLERTQSPFSRDAAPGVQPALRLGTGGRTQSVVLSNRGAALNPRFLSVKSTVEKGSGSERRAYLGFELAGVDLKPFGSAKLRLNLVPSKQGLASYLPPEIRFRVYGIANPPKLDWSVAWEWEGVPSAEAGELLGTIEIPRAQQSGNVELGGAQLMDFLRRHEGGAVLLLLTRETEAPANGSLVHAFASDSHSQAPGPVLEFFVSAQAP